MSESYLIETDPQIVEDTPPSLLPVVTNMASLEQSLETWSEQRKVLTKFIKQHLVEGSDYGKIHVKKDCKDRYTCKNAYHFSKDCLFKAGSEKFLGLLRLKPTFRRDEETWDMLGRPAGVLCLICTLLTVSGEIVGEGRGIRDSQKDGSDYNKSIKMAQKSAQLDAILRTGCLSDVFTQDLDDMMGGEETADTQREKRGMVTTANGTFPAEQPPSTRPTNTSQSIWRETLRVQQQVLLANWTHLTAKEAQVLKGLNQAIYAAQEDNFYPDTKGLALAEAALQWADKLEVDEETNIHGQ